MAATSRVQGDFFKMLPRGSAIVFFAAVFCIFAPIGLLIVSSFAEQRPTLSVLSSIVISGTLAVCWAATFTLSRWFIVGIVVLSAAMIALNGPWAGSPLGIHAGRPSPGGLGVVFLIVTGYTLFVIFISGQGRTTMRLQTEMSLAQQIHDTLVPPLTVRNERFEALGVSSASSEMGGDLIDVVDHERGTDLFVADVSGHGVKAGVVMAMVKAAIRARLQSPESLGDLLTQVNTLIEQLTTDNMYATFAGIRIPENGSEVAFALAGHHSLILLRPDGELRRLDGEKHFPLGLMSQTCVSATVSLGGGDLIAMYTDGLNETEDSNGNELGHAPIEQAICRNAGRPLEELRQAIFDVVNHHGEQNDDRSLLLVRMLST